MRIFRVQKRHYLHWCQNLIHCIVRKVRWHCVCESAQKNSNYEFYNVPLKYVASVKCKTFGTNMTEPLSKLAFHSLNR